MTSNEKITLRKLLRKKRDHYVRTHDMAKAHQDLLHHVVAGVSLSPGAIIGGYWPQSSEVDGGFLLSFFHKQGHTCALPVIDLPAKMLVFHKWEPDEALVPLLVPGHTIPLLIPARCAAVSPTVLLIPVTGFDSQGNRLGQGGGYYDRTLHTLRARECITAIGIAFDCQETYTLPQENHDEKMDFIVTPTRLMKFTGD